MALRVVLADDHHIFRQGLRVLLEREGFEVVGEATDGQEAARLAKALTPDVAVFDLMMPLLNGLDAAREVLEAGAGTHVILLTMHTQEHQISAALKAGIHAYVLKTQAAEDLIQAIREVMRGAIYLSPRVSRIVVDGYLAGMTTAGDSLGARERQVLQLVAEGKTSKEIATILGLSVKKAGTYRTRLMEKLDIHETAGLVRYAIRNGLVQP